MVKGGMIHRCPNCERLCPSTRSLKRHYAEYLRVYDHHHEWSCVKPTILYDGRVVYGAPVQIAPTGWDEEVTTPYKEYYTCSIGPEVAPFEEYYLIPIGPVSLEDHISSLAPQSDFILPISLFGNWGTIVDAPVNGSTVSVVSSKINIEGVHSDFQFGQLIMDEVSGINDDEDAKIACLSEKFYDLASFMIQELPLAAHLPSLPLCTTVEDWASAIVIAENVLNDIYACYTSQLTPSEISTGVLSTWAFKEKMIVPADVTSGRNELLVKYHNLLRKLFLKRRSNVVSSYVLQKEKDSLRAKEKAWDQFENLLSEDDKLEAQGPWNFLKDKLTKAYECVSDASATFLANVLSKLDPFTSLLGPFKEHFYQCLYSLLGRVKNMIKEHWIVAAVGTYFITTLAIVSVVAVLVKLFNFLAASIGIVGISVVLTVSTLLVLFFVTNNMLQLAADLNLCQLIARDFLAFLSQNQDKASVASTLADLKDDATAQGFLPVSFIGLTQVICRLLPKGAHEIKAQVIQLGNLSRACKSANELGVHLKDTAVNYLTALTDAMKIMGSGGVHTIQTLRCLVQHDFVDWTKRVERYAYETYDSLIISPEQRFHILRTLKDQAEDFKKAFYDPRMARDCPRLLLDEFKRLYTDLQTMLEQLATAAMFDEQRLPPVWIYLFSKKGGTGKSTCMMPLGNHIMDQVGEPKHLRFCSRNVASRFMNSYRHQPVFLMDEFGATPTSDYSDEKFMLDIVSPNPFILNMASLNEKSTMFNSKLVISSANRQCVHPDVVLDANMDGYLRRRTVCAEVHVLPGSDFRQTFVLLNGRTEQRVYLDTSGCVVEEPLHLSWDEFKSYCTEVYINHRSDHEKIRESVMQTKSMSTPREKIFETLLLVLKNKVPFDTATTMEVEQFCQQFVYDGDVNPDALNKETYRRILETWEAEISGMSMHDLIMCLPKHMTQTFVYDLMNRNTSVVELGLSPYEQMVYMMCRNRYEHLTDQTPRVFRYLDEKERATPIWNHLLAWIAKIVETLAPWVRMIVYMSAFVMICYSFIYVSSIVFAGAVSLSTIISFASFTPDAPSGVSGDFESTRKTSGVKVKYTTSKDIPYNYKPVGGGASWADMVEDEGAFGQGPAADNQDVGILLKNKLVFINTSNKVVYHALALGGRKLLFTKHVLLSMPASLYIVAGYGIAKEMYIDFDLRKRVNLSDRDLTIVDMPLQFPPRATLPSHLFLKTVAQAPKQAHAFLAVSQPLYERNSVSQIEHQCLEFPVCPKTTVRGTYTAADGTVYQAPACYVYDSMQAGDCSSILFTMDGGRLLLLGLHVASHLKKGAGYAQIITLADFEEHVKFAELDDELIPQGPEYCDPELLYVPGKNSQSYDEVHCLGKYTGPRPHFLTETSLQLSLIATDLKLERTTEPAILSRDDVRLKSSSNPSFDPYLDGMKKYSKEAGPFDEDSDDFQDALDRVFEPYQSLVCNDIPLCKVLNGDPDMEFCESIEAQTSEGFPYCTRRPPGMSGKGWLLTGQPGDWSLIPNNQLWFNLAAMEKDLANNFFNPIVGIDFPKDEKVSISKVYEKPKTRLFTILPLHYNLLVRRFYLSFIMQVMECHNECPVKVGIVPQSNEWGQLYYLLKEKGNNWFNGDYARFDGVTPRCVLGGIVQRINKLYTDNGPVDAWCAKDTRINANQARSMLIDMSNCRYGIASGDLWKVESGIPSGFPLTVIINSFVNSFFLHYAFIKIMARQKDQALKTSYTFNTCVSFAVYGDDNIVSVHNTIAEFYNLRSIAEEMKHFGVLLKNGANKDEVNLSSFYPLDKIDFLKRTFRHIEGHVVAPLNPVNITERLFWVRKGRTEVDALVENVHTAMEEATLHGHFYYTDLKEKILAACGKHGVSVTLPSFRDSLVNFLSGTSYAKAIRAVAMGLPDPIYYEGGKQIFVELFPDVFVCTYIVGKTLGEIQTKLGILPQNVCLISRNRSGSNNGQAYFTLNGDGWAFCPQSVRKKIYPMLKKPLYFVDQANDGLAFAYAADYLVRYQCQSKEQVCSLLNGVLKKNHALLERVFKTFSHVEISDAYSCVTR
uniref:Polyprotein n=1 Tax=Pternopetalum trichomanifolium cheravirus TaxID=3115785 RepID=A0AAT9JAN6_9SECO